MRFFKYLFILFSLFLSSNLYAACESGVSAAFESTLSDPPYTVCASSSSFGGSKCIFNIYSMNKIGNKFDMFGTSTGATCTAETKLDAADDPTKPLECTTHHCLNPDNKACPSGYDKGLYEGALSCVKQDDEPDTLQCTSSYCYNPQGKKCPSGYESGSMNGAAICAKTTDPDPDPDCGTECGNAEIIGAVNDAKDTISGSVNDVGSSVSDGFKKIDETLKAILDKIGSGGDNNNNDDDVTGGVDPDDLKASVPFKEIDTHKLKENLFVSNASCPTDNGLSFSPFGRSFTYKFDYQPVCDSFHTLSFIIMALAYAYAAYIVVKA